MSRAERLRLLFAVLLVVLALDQATKVLARMHLAQSPGRSYLGGVARLEYAENRGAFLSLGANLPSGWREGLLTGLNVLLVVGLTFYLIRGKDLTRWPTLALALLISGGLGNLIDRVIRGGAVVDFMILGIGPVRTGVFNVADLCLTTGAILFAFTGATSGRPEEPEPDAEGSEAE
ncbi:MAG: signal peptidase II [Acidobacteriota bacterium]